MPSETPGNEFVVYVKQELTDPLDGIYVIATEATVVWPDGTEETFGRRDGINLETAVQLPETEYVIRRLAVGAVFEYVTIQWAKVRAPGVGG